uniref:Uncharacterized protein n=1 Tax=Peronospora matthiolae TaxID=2874970 RepID=A0AAV1TXI2_9STRA
MAEREAQTTTRDGFDEDVGMDATLTPVSFPDYEDNLRSVAVELSAPTRQSTDKRSISLEPHSTHDSCWPPVQATMDPGIDLDDIVMETLNPTMPGEIIPVSRSGPNEGVVLDHGESPSLVFEWIRSLHGLQVDVPSDGQSLYSAIFASTTNVQASTFYPSVPKPREINAIKQQVTDLILANMRYDVQLMLIDPAHELERLYQTSTLPVPVEAATAALYAHYAASREQCVSTALPSAFWSETTILRALAMYLREPVYVWGVDETGNCSARQFSFQTFAMPDEDAYETGIVLVLDVERVRVIPEACYKNKVILSC